jgi:hypothetical protein
MTAKMSETTPVSSFRFIYKANLALVYLLAQARRAPCRPLSNFRHMREEGGGEPQEEAIKGGPTQPAPANAGVGVGEQTSLDNTVMCAARAVHARGLLRR